MNKSIFFLIFYSAGQHVTASEVMVLIYQLYAKKLCMYCIYTNMHEFQSPVLFNKPSLSLHFENALFPFFFFRYCINIHCMEKKTGCIDFVSIECRSIHHTLWRIILAFIWHFWKFFFDRDFCTFSVVLKMSEETLNNLNTKRVCFIFCFSFDDHLNQVTWSSNL